MKGRELDRAPHLQWNCTIGSLQHGIAFHGLSIFDSASNQIPLVAELEADDYKSYNDMIRDLLASDTFSTYCIGYWAKGVKFGPKQQCWVLKDEPEVQTSKKTRQSNFGKPNKTCRRATIA